MMQNVWFSSQDQLVKNKHPFNDLIFGLLLILHWRKCCKESIIHINVFFPKLRSFELWKRHLLSNCIFNESIKHYLKIFQSVVIYCLTCHSNTLNNLRNVLLVCFCVFDQLSDYIAFHNIEGLQMLNLKKHVLLQFELLSLNGMH